jgi:hypothetical protein
MIMMSRASIFAFSVMLSAVFVAPSYAQSTSSTVTYGHPGALLSIYGVTNEANRAIMLAATRISESLNQDKRDAGESTFALRVYPPASSWLAASFPVYQNAGKPTAQLSHLFAGDNEHGLSMEGLAPTESD